MLKSLEGANVTKSTRESTKERFPPLARLHRDGCRMGPVGLPGCAWTLQSTLACPPLRSPEIAAGPGPGAVAPSPAPVALGSCSRGPWPRRGSCCGYFTGLSPRCCCFSSARAPPRPGIPDPSLGLCMSRRCRMQTLTLKLALGFLLPAWLVPVGVLQCSFWGLSTPSLGHPPAFAPSSL